MEVPDVAVAIPKKKGRPAKIKDDKDVVPTEPKKRGRKPKAETTEVQEPKPRKKRGRKAAVKYFSSSIRKKIPLTTVIPDNNNFILHLDVKEDDDDACDQSSTYNGVEVVDSVTATKGSCQASEAMLEKQVDEFLDNDSGVLAAILDDDGDLRDLYEKRINFRDGQDKKLLNKLESLHKDDNLLDRIMTKDIFPKKSRRAPLTAQSAASTSKEEEKEENTQPGVFPLLEKFIDNEDWLTRTNVCCWWCCHKFSTLPVGLPQDFSMKTRKFRVTGVFCGFPCMVAYAKNSPRASKQYLIQHLHSRLTAQPLDSELKPAPPRCALKMFGGNLSIDEFRESVEKHMIYRMVQYPMFVSRDYIESIDIANVKKANSRLFDDNAFVKVVNLDDQRVAGAKLRLSAQIEKSTVTTGNTIDKFINIS